MGGVQSIGGGWSLVFRDECVLGVAGGKGLERPVLFLLVGVVSCGGGQPRRAVLALAGVGSVED